MCFGGTPPKPPQPMVTQPLPQTEQAVEQAVVSSRESERRRRRAAVSGYDSTLMSGGAGVMNPASTGQKQLLGL